jgi:hypothetical protein
MLLALALVALFAFQPATADVEQGSFGFTYNDNNGDRGWGARSHIPYQTGIVKGHVSGTAQKSTLSLRGKWHAEIGLTRNNWDLNLYSDGTLISDKGRDAAAGLAIELPEQKVGIFEFTGGAGFFGSNAGKFGGRNAYGDLEALKYSPDDLDGRNLENLHPAPRGLSIKLDNRLGILGYAEFLHEHGKIRVSLKPELFGQGDPVNQAVIVASTAAKIANGWVLEFEIDYRIQTFEGEVETDMAVITGISKTWK